MSKLARKITSAPVAESRTPPGPANKCRPLYGEGDLEDFEAVSALRAAGHEWRAIQSHVDKQLGITKHIQLDAFRRHWRRRCYCWPEDLRL